MECSTLLLCKDVIVAGTAETISEHTKASDLSAAQVVITILMQVHEYKHEVQNLKLQLLIINSEINLYDVDSTIMSIQGVLKLLNWELLTILIKALSLFLSNF